jgi:hypothetical protein
MFQQSVSINITDEPKQFANHALPESVYLSWPQKQTPPQQRINTGVAGYAQIARVKRVSEKQDAEPRDVQCVAT